MSGVRISDPRTSLDLLVFPERSRVEETGLGCELSPFSEVFFQRPANPLETWTCDAPGQSPFSRVRNRSFGMYLGRSNFLRGPKCVSG